MGGGGGGAGTPAEVLGRAGKGLATFGKEPLLNVGAGGEMPTDDDERLGALGAAVWGAGCATGCPIGTTFGCACVVMVGTTVVLLEIGSLPAAGTSTTTEHLGQRAFLPAYFASTLNFALQAVQRHKTSDMVESLWK